MEHKFKIGDEVKIITLGCFGDEQIECCKRHGYTLKGTYKITEVINNTNYRLGECGFSGKYLKYAKMSLKTFLEGSR